MNNSVKKLIRVAGIFLIVAIASFGNAIAQDKAAAPKAEAPKAVAAKADAPKAEAPKKGEPVRKVLLENESVNVIDVTFRPGDVSASRSRPARLIYYFTTGSLHLTFADGKTEVRSFKAGEAVWRSAETVEVKNNGKSIVHLMQVTAKTK